MLHATCKLTLTFRLLIFNIFFRFCLTFTGIKKCIIENLPIVYMCVSFRMVVIA